MAPQVIINEVGPRDGLQNQTKILSVAQRVQLITALQNAQLNHIEVGAFVSPKAVPAMADTHKVLAEINDHSNQLSVLIPNTRGYELAVASGAKTVAMVLYGSDGMAQKNVNMTRHQTDEAAERILRQAQTDSIHVIATIAVAFECPFDGPTHPDVVVAASQRFLELGAAQIVIADTIGAANPAQVASLMSRLGAELGTQQLACHFHDTRALGLANVYAALASGIRRFDASIAGLGGCPFAPGATGNVATEDVVMLLHSMGYSTGIDLDNLLQASDLAAQLTGAAQGGRSKTWLKPYLDKGGQL